MTDRNKKASNAKPAGQMVKRGGYNGRPFALTSTPATSLQSFTESKLLHDLSGIRAENTSSITCKRTGPNYSKRLEAEKLSLDLTHARYMQSVYLDGMLHKFIEQHTKDETTYLAQLSLLISELSDHNAYLERMLMAARHQKKMKEVIQQQDKCLSDVKLWLEKSLMPFKSLVDALDHTRHALRFRNITLNSDEISKFSRQLNIAEILMEKITNNLQSCNLLQASNAYGQLNTTLNKEITLLQECKLKIGELEDAVIQTSSLRMTE